MFHRKTFMVNLAKTFNKNMESVPAWNMQHIRIDQIDLNDQMDGIAQIVPESIINVIRKALRQSPSRQSAVSARLNHFLLSYPKSGRASHLCLPSLNHLSFVQYPFSDMIQTFKMTTNSNTFGTFS